ncbi:universal stress protein [Olleya sp. HaHaR_3_96]|uniref:universal stress protein n=1 Tax=Olleya sp. HaHaR_3_96 TaxID=2745560 RepID=UPI001C4F476C|nr:universal stress protein [Olleya sp. HaHaR_3_96]QXP60466.1 universal stress protein [Olleya sp. HaHaR_3_96]
MKNNRYKILVLSDLNKSAALELKSTVSLAKMMDGDITLFHVKKPTDIVERESQLSAIRAINEDHIATNKKIEGLIKPIQEEFKQNVNYQVAIGNIKYEIEAYIDAYQPDMIVLGRRKSKTLNFMGDNITDFVLKKYNGTIMIAAEQHALQPNEDVTLGVLNTTDKSVSTDFIEGFVNKTSQPIKAFKIVTNLTETENSLNNKTVEYVFQKGTKAVDNVSKYALKSNINLMCFDNSKHDKSNTSIKKVISKLNVSLLLTGKNTTMLPR